MRVKRLGDSKLEQVNFTPHPAAPQNPSRSEKYFKIEEEFGISILSFEVKSRKVTYRCGNCQEVITCDENSVLRKKSSGCGKCSNSLNKITFSDIVSIFKEYGMRVLWSKEEFQTKYVNKDTPISYICTCGGVGSTRVADIKSGRKCGNCKFDRA